MTSEVLTISVDGPVATVTLNRPERFNALNDELRAALRSAVADINAMDNVLIVILKGEGRGFCAGADLGGGMERPDPDHINKEYKPALVGIAESDKIWIAQIHGTAAGIGAAYAMNCDLVTMADDATIYMAFAAIALIPDGGNTQLLLQNMGYHRALETILEGQKVSAQDCVKHGLANKLFPLNDLDRETKAWAERLASGGPLALSATKRMLRSVGHLSYADAISAEAKEQHVLLNSEDFKTGVAAFFDKTKPVFNGK
jgi:2-(1,2-epoxy-1,2-dihydrophenyl)acetyl-CoA isomerase